MLFASCIRQGMIRCTPDLLRQSDAPRKSYSEITAAMESIPELQEVSATADIVPDAVEAEVYHEDSERADLETLAFDLLKDLTGGNKDEIKKLLKGREISQMSIETLRDCVTAWQELEVN
jgi:hypothetical protein